MLRSVAFRINTVGLPCRTQRFAAQSAKPFVYQDIFELTKPVYKDVPFRKLNGDFVSTSTVDGKTILKVDSKALRLLASQAMIDIAHLLRPAHLQSLSNILKDDEASNNDKFVALELLKNANIAAGMILPGCQDTGTAICMGKKGQYVWTEGSDAEALSLGIYDTYTQKNLRYSQTLGTAACPPYHLALVIGGTSAETTLKTVKMASAKYLDNLPITGNEHGRAFRDLESEAHILKLTQTVGIGAQFGGKYFCHDVRVIRLPRHGASCPVGIGVSCSADRQILGRITNEGVFLEQLEKDPSIYLPDPKDSELSGEVVNVNLNRPMEQVLSELSSHSIRTRLSLTGTLVVARDIAHAKIKERLDAGESIPRYLCDHPVYYAGPAKTPEGYASGSFGPTTAGRMDSYVDQFQAAGGSKVMLAKGNRSKQVTSACKKHGGFYLGSVGGPAAILAQNCIKKVQVLEYAELGMEAIWRVEVENFPAFIIVDDKGNDFFKEWQVE